MADLDRDFLAGCYSPFDKAGTAPLSSEPPKKKQKTDKKDKNSKNNKRQMHEN